MSAYRPAMSKKLKSQLEKLYKRDRQLFTSVMNKIEDILDHPHRYKPLRHDLKGFYRVHIEKSFVLIFIIEENNLVVQFIDLKHHDEIYKRKT